MRISCLFLLLASCYAQVGSKKAVDPASAHTCSNFCRDMSLELGAVVVMADNVGCVCNPKQPAAAGAAPTSNASAAAGGIAVLLKQQEEAEEEERKKRQR
jgi:hypothetical protein